MEFFRSADHGPFCSDEHEELYRQTAALRPGNPYTASNVNTENSTNPVAANVSPTHDLAQLLNAVQSGSAVRVEATTATASDLATPAPATSSASSQTLTHVRMLGAADIANPLRNETSVGIAIVPAESAPKLSDSKAAGRANANISVSTTVRVEKIGSRSERQAEANPVITAACLRDPKREKNCSLVGRSGDRLECNGDCELTAGEVIVTQLQDQLVAAEVKQWGVDGNKYMITAEHVESISRNDASSSSTTDIRVDQKSGDASPAGEERGPAGPQPSISGGKTLLAVASALVLPPLLMMCVLQFQSALQPAASSALAPAAAQRTPPPPSGSSTPSSTSATAASGKHHVEIRALQSTWIETTSDGRKVFGGMITKGDTQNLEYSKFGYLHLGNASGVGITVDGQTVPLSKPGLRLVELSAAGFRFLRWSNDDPAQP